MAAAQDVKLENFDSIFSLKGKVAVVTGGSRGLGLQAASGLMQAGMSERSQCPFRSSSKPLRSALNANTTYHRLLQDLHHLP